MKRLTCQIESIDYFNADTRRVVLRLPPTERIDFKAGQYLEIILPDKKYPFSIASAPGKNNLVELHIKPTVGSDDSVQIETLLDSADHMDIEIPKGDCYIETPPGNALILIAASTGITQMKSIVEHLLPNGFDFPVYLYWGVPDQKDLYLSDLCEQWEKSYPNFYYIPVVSEPRTSPAWRGRTGLVGNAVLDDFDDLSGVTIYVSGGPAMVYATLDAFLERGMPEASMHSDIFSYAPRLK